MEALNTNFKVNGLTRLGIKRVSTTPEADTDITWSSKVPFSGRLIACVSVFFCSNTKLLNYSPILTACL